MKFRGLPADMKVAGADVRPRGRLTLPLLPCGFCKFFHVDYFLCEKGHVLCIDCGNDDLHKARGDRVESPCFGCGKIVPMQKIHVDVEQLRYERFCCACSHEGTLAEIQMHLHSAKYGLACILIDKTPTEMEINHFKNRLYELDTVKSKLDEAEDLISAFFDLHFAKPSASLKSHATNKQLVRRIEERLVCVKNLLQEVDVMNNEMRPTLEAMFKGNCWLVLKTCDIFPKHRHVLRTVIYGVAVEVLSKQEIYDGALWLGMFIRGCDFDMSGLQKRKDAYPLKAKITIRIHNSRGYEVGKGSFVTFDNNTYTSASFKDPFVEESVFVGVDKLILMSDVRKPEMIVGNKIRLSFQFEPLLDM
ncbi:uncharacterized protein LOC100906751 [Galendromus occidentalis]|uniref:Uncharacterized protein LOC100906751 n=1 Tax=Galendromus occidentalis TaxID=34638 RepID=A0AAJ6QWT8_9ACAR|nr:uncharacterized protein LOC100906751 [Galendromus occidentalis]